ncbi:peptidoglycan hydrolase CwlO-like protein [Alkalibacillus flavidus]|uniref:Peptidoglycan hydrolase CwlO-like protein n=1 Tax=Alkalibacillus flavidus TaxID=546021 RepID=A0ABV2KTQ2_9BACI
MLTKKWMIFLSLTVVFAGVMVWTGTTTTEANESTDEIEQELNEVQEERESITNELDNLQEQLDQLEQQQAQTEDELAQINNEIQQAELEVRQKELDIEKTETEIRQLEAEIRKLENEIEQLEAEIKQLEQEIKETKERIAEREVVLKDRLRSLQKNGGSVRYLEVILGASDFGDFISRTTAVNKVMEQDQDILDQHAADKKHLEETVAQVEETKAEVEDNKASVEQNKQEVESKQETLVAQKQDLDQLIANLNDRREEQEVILANLEQEEDELESYRVSLAEEEDILKARENSLQRQIERAESGPPASSNSSATFITPMDGYLTSNFGHRWGRQHFGTDIGNLPNPTTPIYAAASGEVYRVVSGCVVGDRSCGGGYGNVVYMTHYIDGVAYDTVYAHMTSVNVSVGQTVEQGQQIGRMGNTGASGGPHLHFEIHRGGGWNNAKSNAVDPRQYISVPSRSQFYSR